MPSAREHRSLRLLAFGKSGHSVAANAARLNECGQAFFLSGDHS